MTHQIDLRCMVGALALNVQALFGNEVVIISGENGAGKTTLLRCVAGLERADGYINMVRRVWLDSAQGVSLPVTERRIGMLSADTVLLPWLSVQQNMVLGCSALDSDWLDELVHSMEVSHLLQRHPAMLSTGEAQRISLVRALYRRPSLLLLDEPFSAQSPALRGRLRMVLRRFQQELNLPVLLVTHDLEDADLLADQHWRLCGGSCVIEGV
ncbi:MAG: ATP-binding cassette domain-containing protein [Mariprofundales bacterium]|nr:ATP-binding cassette domain-containing protein [Mariprofundales bacterium]